MRIKGLTYACLGTAILAAVYAGSACSASAGDNGFQETSSGGDPSGGNGGSGGLDIGSGQGGGVLVQEPNCDGVDPNIDNDHDGVTGAQGDCNDCTAQMNPGAQDYPGNGIDEDCNGKADDNPTNCDSGLAVDSLNPLDGAKALGLCKMQQGASWGLISAKYVTADGQPLDNYDPQGLGHGILNDFGPNVNVQEGKAMLALSSGTARKPTHPGYQPVEGYDKGYGTNAPAGYPKESPDCMVTTGDPHDAAGLLVDIKTPTNAKSLSFNLNFYTYEFPQYVCSTYNDFFVAILSPTPPGQADGNISFDSKGNLISVNAGFLQVCHPQNAGPNNKKYDCPLGPSQLLGTGFDEDTTGFLYPDNSAATGWLQTIAPIADPGSNISLLFTVWDSGDGFLDSTVLLDNFTFDVKPSETGTAPIDVPK